MRALVQSALGVATVDLEDDQVVELDEDATLELSSVETGLPRVVQADRQGSTGEPRSRSPRAQRSAGRPRSTRGPAGAAV